MNRLESMAVFIEVVKGGSLSAAGRTLQMPLPTVSRKISDLESHLKTRLLHRSTRKLTLTDAGKTYLTACKRILEEVDDAERTAAGEYSSPTGELFITAPIAFGRLHVLPVVIEFLSAHPDVHVRLVLQDRSLDFLEDHIDLAVRIGELPDSSLVATRIGTVRPVVCGSPGYFARRGALRRPEDLLRHECITFSRQMSPERWDFNGMDGDLALPVHSRLVVNTAEAAIDAAIRGAGVTRVLSYQVEQAARAGKLVTVLAKYETAPIPVSLVYPTQGPLPLKLRVFLDFAAPKLRAALNSPMDSRRPRRRARQR